MARHLLLASHGSSGSMVAEQAAVRACLPGDSIDHLYVIPSWWADMTGDDWLNNGVTRNRFRDYLAEQLWQESQANVARVQDLCAQNKIQYQSQIKIGDSAKCLYSVATNYPYDAIYLGDQRPKYVTGIRDRMLTSANKKLLADRLYIVSLPNE